MAHHKSHTKASMSRKGGWRRVEGGPGDPGKHLADERLDGRAETRPPIVGHWVFEWEQLRLQPVACLRQDVRRPRKWLGKDGGGSGAAASSRTCRESGGVRLEGVHLDQRSNGDMRRWRRVEEGVDELRRRQERGGNLSAPWRTPLEQTCWSARKKSWSRAWSVTWSRRSSTWRCRL